MSAMIGENQCELDDDDDDDGDRYYGVYIRMNQGTGNIDRSAQLEGTASNESQRKMN